MGDLAGTTAGLFRGQRERPAPLVTLRPTPGAFTHAGDASRAASADVPAPRVCRSVSWTGNCGRGGAAARRSAPWLSRCVAKLWRSPWGLMRLGSMPATTAYCLTSTRTVREGDSPLCSRNSGASARFPATCGRASDRYRSSQCCASSPRHEAFLAALAHHAQHAPRRLNPVAGRCTSLLRAGRRRTSVRNTARSRRPSGVSTSGATATRRSAFPTTPSAASAAGAADRSARSDRPRARGGARNARRTRAGSRAAANCCAANTPRVRSAK